MEESDLKIQIINWLNEQPLKPAKNTELTGETYFSVLAGVRNDFNEIKIHLSRYPETFINMCYAEGKTFSLSDFFDDDTNSEQKIYKLANVLKDISISYSVSEKAICIPYILIVEDDDSEEEFYDTKVYPCGLGGTQEKYVDGVYIGICWESLRHEIILLAKDKIIAVSIDDSDSNAIEAIGLTGDFKSAGFGNITLMESPSLIALDRNEKCLSITLENGKVQRWSLESNFIW